MSRIGQPPSKSGGGVTDHTLLTNIGTTTHANIDIALTKSGARVYSNTTQNITQNNWATVAFNTEAFDIGGEFGTANYRFTATNAGVYVVTNAIATTGAVKLHVGVHVNGTLQFRKITQTTVAYTNEIVSGVVNLAASDYVEFVAMSEAAGTTVIQNDSSYTFGCIARVC